MDISLKCNFDLNFDVQELLGQHDFCLRDLLVRLASKEHANVDFIDPRTDEVDDYFTVCINGREYRYLPKRLETRLNPGDEVRITVLPMGGGC